MCILYIYIYIYIYTHIYVYKIQDQQAIGFKGDLKFLELRVVTKPCQKLKIVNAVYDHSETHHNSLKMEGIPMLCHRGNRIQYTQKPHPNYLTFNNKKSVLKCFTCGSFDPLATGFSISVFLTFFHYFYTHLPFFFACQVPLSFSPTFLTFLF